jgi:hypothetical protein
MPIIRPNIVFNATSVATAPQSTGVYALLEMMGRTQAGIVFYGKAESPQTLRGELTIHLGGSALAKRSNITHFIYEETSTPDARCRALLAEMLDVAKVLPRENQ